MAGKRHFKDVRGDTHLLKEIAVVDVLLELPVVTQGLPQHFERSVLLIMVRSMPFELAGQLGVEDLSSAPDY